MRLRRRPLCEHALDDVRRAHRHALESRDVHPVLDQSAHHLSPPPRARPAPHQRVLARTRRPDPRAPRPRPAYRAPRVSADRRRAGPAATRDTGRASGPRRTSTACRRRAAVPRSKHADTVAQLHRLVGAVRRQQRPCIVPPRAASRVTKPRNCRADTGRGCASARRAAGRAAYPSSARAMSRRCRMPDENSPATFAPVSVELHQLEHLPHAARAPRHAARAAQRSSAGCRSLSRQMSARSLAAADAIMPRTARASRTTSAPCTVADPAVREHRGREHRISVVFPRAVRAEPGRTASPVATSHVNRVGHALPLGSERRAQESPASPRRMRERLHELATGDRPRSVACAPGAWAASASVSSVHARGAVSRATAPCHSSSRRRVRQPVQVAGHVQCATPARAARLLQPARAAAATRRPTAPSRASRSGAARASPPSAPRRRAPAPRRAPATPGCRR